ncbi:sensor histidine kinase [Paenibacillus agaridevorans]|uniref:histidine kinase n=1 Tax=Paenibacillus agaridevorans TaxID=171404 RepID=A0A2R5EYM1_9BACL|nr:sensor histidine kinase [Paenibacillus agaridevorans]GBG11802.1 sensor histidine kinase [Paenibacillus agaridevorans]
MKLKSVWKFIRYQRSYIIMCFACYSLAMAVSYADPGFNYKWDTYLYGLGLLALLITAFFAYRYVRETRSIALLREEEGEPMTLEGEACQDELHRMETEHIRKLNEVNERGLESYRFMVSWFHEIKTPIAVLRLIQQTDPRAADMDEELSRIEHYVDQALYHAKLDSFYQDYDIVSCDLEQLVKNMVKQHAKTFIAKKIKLALQIESAAVQSDPKWLSFVLQQLITNSLKYTDTGGVMSVTASETASEIRLTVRDNGAGIDPKDLPRIFNRGFTGENGRVYGKSTGMGLYLAQELCAKLGHYLTCQSEKGSYTEMTIHFPRNHDPYLDAMRIQEKSREH